MKPSLKDIWENKHLILQGVVNRMFSPNKELANRRLRICASCPFNSENSGDKTPPYKHCTKCGCALALKPYVENAKCPLNYWND